MFAFPLFTSFLGQNSPQNPMLQTFLWMFVPKIEVEMLKHLEFKIKLIGDPLPDVVSGLKCRK